MDWSPPSTSPATARRDRAHHRQRRRPRDPARAAPARVRTLLSHRRRADRACRGRRRLARAGDRAGDRRGPTTVRSESPTRRPAERRFALDLPASWLRPRQVQHRSSGGLRAPLPGGAAAARPARFVLDDLLERCQAARAETARARPTARDPPRPRTSLSQEGQVVSVGQRVGGGQASGAQRDPHDCLQSRRQHRQTQRSAHLLAGVDEARRPVRNPRGLRWT